MIEVRYSDITARRQGIKTSLRALPSKGDRFFVDGKAYDVVGVEHRIITGRVGSNILVLIQPI